MGRQGREPNEFEPNELEDFEPEKPMSSDDAIGAPTQDRYNRELAFRAWEYLARHKSSRPLPSWVADYLRDVAGKVLADLGPRGSLSPASAHAALGLVGEKWPKHHPESVYAIINAWIDPDRPGGPLVSGRKAGAVRYIDEYMDGGRNVSPETVIEWYRKGQKAHKRQAD